MTKQKKTEEKRIKALLKELNWTQTKLAEALKVDRTALSGIVNNKRPLSKGMAAQIAQATGARVDWLLDGEGEMFEETAASIYDAAINAGASEMAAGIVDRYLKLPPKERATFERILTEFLIAPVDGARVQSAIKTLCPGVVIGRDNHGNIRIE